MASQKSVQFQVSVAPPKDVDAGPLQINAFTASGRLIGAAPVEKGVANLMIPAELDGQNLELVLGPLDEKGATPLALPALKKKGGLAGRTRFLARKPSFELIIPDGFFSPLCRCTVRGRLVKRITLPDGTLAEQRICNARVHILEVDRLPDIIVRLPDSLVKRLRDDLLQKLRPIPRPDPIPFPFPAPFPGPFPGPIPGPDPAPFQVRSAPAPFTVNDQALRDLGSAGGAGQIRQRLLEFIPVLPFYLCEFPYLFGWFLTEELAVVEVDHEGRFSRRIWHRCGDQPDIYLWVEQFQNGIWQTIYRPHVGCNTYWNYVCGTQIELNLPHAEGCEDPGYDLPPGVTLFLLPHRIGNTPIWGKPALNPPAPRGWVRPDGYTDYSTAELGDINNAPFGGTLHFYHDDSYFIPTDGVKYYRYSYRAVGDTNWSPIATPLSRGYRLEYSDRLPTYEQYPVGPKLVGSTSGLFEFKPQDPPPSGIATEVAREWLSGNLSEVAASWDTGSLTGDYDVRIEVFNQAGAQVLPGPATFQFLMMNANQTTTRVAEPGELAGGAYVFRVHLDNNPAAADLPQPSIGGVAASDDCGFLRYNASSSVKVRFLAAHPNNHAVFGFGIKRGSNWVPGTVTLAPYVEVASANAPTPATPYTKVAGYYERDFAPNELVGACGNAAFAASLGVYRKVTNGYHRLGGDASGLIAFALATEDPDV